MTATTKAGKGMSTQLTRGHPSTAGARRGGVVEARRGRAASGDVRMIKVGDVQRNPDNPQGRSSVDESLVNSVREVGVIQDLVLVPVEQWLAAHPGRENELSDAPYVVLTGHRRLAAAVQAERDEVPARVREDFDETTLDSVVLHENLHRLALTPVEEARAYERIMQRRGLSQRQLAKHTGVSQPQISKKLKLLGLPSGIQEAVEAGLIGIEQSAAVLDEDDEVVEVLDQMVAATADGESIDLDSLIMRARIEVRTRQAQESARQQATERKATFTEPTELGNALGLGRSEYPGERQLHDDKDIAKAQEDGALVVSYTQPSPYAASKTTFFTTERPKRQTAAEPSKGASADRERTKANRARRAALRDLVTSPPKVDVIRAELLAWAIAGGGWASAVMDIARPLLHAAGLVDEDVTYWGVKRTLQELSDKQQHHAVWIMMLATRDEAVGLPLHRDHWGQEHIEHYEWMIERGYEPGEWEQQMLTEGRKALQESTDDEGGQ